MWRLALFETGVQILTYVKSDINIDGVYKYQRVFQYKQQKKTVLGQWRIHPRSLKAVERTEARDLGVSRGMLPVWYSILMNNSSVKGWHFVRRV